MASYAFPPAAVDHLHVSDAQLVSLYSFDSVAAVPDQNLFVPAVLSSLPNQNCHGFQPRGTTPR